MIPQTIHIPQLYRDVPDGESGKALYCDAVYRIVRDAEVNCVILIDDEGVLYTEITEAIKDWPLRYRQKTMERIEKMLKLNRFVRIDPARYSCDSNCSSIGCQHAAGMAASLVPDAVFSPMSCARRSFCSESASVSVGTYNISSFATKRYKAEHLEVPPRTWTKEKFEREVWEPLFRYAKQVKIYDRWVGKQFDEQLRNRRKRHRDRPGDPPPLKFGDNYERGLRWVFSQFLTHSAPNRSRIFEVTCALNANDWDEGELGAAAMVLRDFASGLSQKYGFPFDIKVKREVARDVMRHARFLFTDQVKLLVERGIDLLEKDDMVRDVMIKHVADPGRIQDEIERLQEVV